MKVTGEKLVGFKARAIFALCAALALCVATATPAFAQNNGEQQYDVPPSRSCAGANVVQTVEGPGDQVSPQFDITGGRFTVLIEPESAVIGVIVDVQDENDGFVSGVVDNPEIIDEGPGSFFLDIDDGSAEDNYTITVTDCADEAGVGPVDTTNPGDTNNPGDVVDGTTPDKPLPDTGGLPLAGFVLIGLALVGVGGSIVRAGVERRS